MLVMDCRLAILPNKLIKSQATISKKILRGGNPPQPLVEFLNHSWATDTFSTETAVGSYYAG